jgi:hypothetical protein
MANVVIDIAAQYTGNKAFKQAETATQKLEKSVGRLGKQLLSVFAAGKLLQFGKNAAKAFAADEKAARSLSLALANTGNAFAAIEVEKFIGDLQRATGVLDDQLRPAFRTLLTATGNVKKSQDGLALALDIAAGTGKDLGAVSMALAKAYGGQTTALSRLGAGLSKATLASGDMDVIVGELTKKFQGQALAAADGYSGSMDRLKVASENAKEIIGKDLLDAMKLIAGDEGIGGATTAMESFATEIGNVIYATGVLASKLDNLSVKGKSFRDIYGISLGELFNPLGEFTILGQISRFGARSKASSAITPAQSPGDRKKIEKINADAARIQKRLNDLNKIDTDNTVRKITLTGDQLALQELEKKFDVERIGLFAALNQATDSETQMRLKSLIAIHDQNAALAGQIMKTNSAADAMENFGKAMFGALDVMLNFGKFALGERDTLRAMGIGVTPISQGFQSFTPPTGGYEGFGSGMTNLGTNNYGGLAGAGQAGGGGAPVVNVVIQGSVTTERDLVSAITQGIYNNQASGIPINYSTAY